MILIIIVLYLINFCLSFFALLITIELFSSNNLKENIYYDIVIKLNSYITKYIYKIFKKKNYALIFIIIIILILKAVIIYFYNDIYDSKIYGWNIRYYYLDSQNKKLSELSFIKSLNISILSYISIIYKFILIISLLYFAKKRLIKLSKIFDLFFDIVEPLYVMIRKSYYGGLKYHTSIILIAFATIYYYVIWIILSLRIDFHSFVNGIIVSLSLINNLIFWYSVFLLVAVFLTGLNIIKNRKLNILIIILYGPVKLKTEKYFTVKGYKFNKGLLMSGIILFAATILMSHILNDVLFQQYNFNVL